MNPSTQKKLLLTLSLLAIPVFAWLFWPAQKVPTLPAVVSDAQKAGEETLRDLLSLPALALSETEDSFTVEDDGKSGIEISFSNQSADNSQQLAEEELKTTLTLPKDYSQPITVDLGQGKVVTLTDLSGSTDYAASVLTDSQQSTINSQRDLAQGVIPGEDEESRSFITRFLDRLGMTKKEDSLESPASKYLAYLSPDQRKTLLYAYQKDRASGEAKLKHWTLYKYGTGEETESYRIGNAKVRIDQEGNARVFHFGEQDAKSEQAQADVDPSLMDRAQRFLQEELGNDLANDENRQPDFTIPKPLFYDQDGIGHEGDWTWDDTTKTLSVSISASPDDYPLALDPTLSFTAPGTTNGGSVITGESASYFGNAMVAGDFNADGRMDLAVGAYAYPSNVGRAYIFYGDGVVPTATTSADVSIAGESSSNLGISLVAGDFNADGKTDLAVGAYGYLSDIGRAYIFYNDGSMPTTAAAADIIITGEAANTQFGWSMVSGDFNADGRTDLAVGAYRYSSDTGRAYIFHGGSIITEAATGADIIITGEINSRFGSAFTTGDFNADGETDLAVGGWGYSTLAGRAYIFYGGSIVTEDAVGADIIITGEVTSYFGWQLIAGDFNADGRTDLSVGAYQYSSDTGRAYIFYSGSIITENASGADVIITGEAGDDYLGTSLTAGDFNADGRTDLAAGAYQYSANEVGRVYIFYNDGSIPTTAATADVIITGGGDYDYFGTSLASGDLNADGRTDLIVGARGFSSNAGRTYLFYSQNGQVNTNKSIVGETTDSYFGTSLASGDFNADGRIDIAVGAPGYSADTGRAYIFYGDGQVPSSAGTADVVIIGETTNDHFGTSLVSGDFNADGKTDLAVGANGFASSDGRAYIFYNDSSIPTTAATADIKITGGAASDQFGISLVSGDFNADSRTDLAVGAYGYSTSTGRAYLFHNDGSIPTTAATADVIITGESTGNSFGSYMTAGDFNGDARIDLAVASYAYVTSTGRVYLFYNDGAIPTTAATADIVVTGGATGSRFGWNLVSGDLNTDGRTDLLIGANGANKVYIFYNDGSYPSAATGADIVIVGTGAQFGVGLVPGDFDADGRVDIAVGASGKVYYFYNDGSIPTTAATADVTISGSGTFGDGMVGGDLNNDGRIDLMVVNYQYSTFTGQVFIYETRENFAWELEPVSGLRTSPSFAGQEMKITGESGTTGQFGSTFATGDWNADGRTDLAVGASAYNSNTGRVYLFYDDGSLASGASSADAIISGEATNNNFGYSLAAGDWNADGRTDLAIGADGHSDSAGRVYLFYGDGAYPSAAATADVIIQGEAESSFGNAMVSGDFNQDGRTDLAVGAESYTLINTGRVYIFHGGSIITENASGADVKITGETIATFFASSLVAGDFNSDGTTDLAVGAWAYYGSSTGRVYVFHNDGSYPAGSAGADVIITGEAASSFFGESLTSGDFNQDGRTDLAVGARGYSSSTGRAYIFYNDGSLPTTAATADVIITGEASSAFGRMLVSGDFNQDGRTDLAVGASAITTNTGRAYLFHNDGSIPTTAATADLILVGEATGSYYGSALTAGDFNQDGRTDLVVGAYGYKSNQGRMYLYTFQDGVITGGVNDSLGGFLVAGDFNQDGRTDLAVGADSYATSTGRVYIFHGGSIVTENASGADVIIQGESAYNFFGSSMVAGDFNQDGRTDLAVGAYGYSTYTGRAYIFHGGSIVTENASGADVIITGEAMVSFFGWSITAGDWNADSWTDLAVGAFVYSSSTGRAYLFHNDGSYPSTAGTAEVIITGETTNNFFGSSMVAGDFNQDGRTDLAVGAYGYSTGIGRAYIFHGGSIITEGASGADVIIQGEAGGDFGWSLAVGDFNADGRTDLVVGAYAYSSSAGRVYIFHGGSIVTENASGADVIIQGEANSSFSHFMVSADLNQDGRTDLVVGAEGYSSSTGRVYIFYDDGSYPTTAAAADAIITGEATASLFGDAFTSGDFNQDGMADLAVGAYGHNSNAGRVYVYITEAEAVAEEGGAKLRGSVQMRGNLKVR